MEVFEAVRTVLAVRKYRDQAVPPEIVRRIVEAGRLTGSSMNGQPWHFIVVQDRDLLRQLGALAKTGPYVAQHGSGWESRRLRLSTSSSTVENCFHPGQYHNDNEYFRDFSCHCLHNSYCPAKTDTVYLETSKVSSFTFLEQSLLLEPF